MTIQVDNALPPNVVEIGNEITQGVVDGLMSASPSASSANPYLTVNGAASTYLPLAGGNMTGDIVYISGVDPEDPFVLRLKFNGLYLGGQFNPAQFTENGLSWDGTVSNYNYSGITFYDGTVQTTAAVAPTFATDAEAIAGTSASTVMSPAISQYGMKNWAIPASVGTAVSTGTVNTNSFGSRCQLTATASGQYAIVFPTNSSINTFTTTGTGYADCNFSKRIKIYGRIYISPVANLNCYYSWGRGNNNIISQLGSPQTKGFGIRIQGTGVVELQVHNGTTLTNVSTTFTPVNGVQFDCLIDSLGDGTVNLYINGALSATSSAGATGTGAAVFPLLIQELSSTASSTIGNFYVSGRAIYMA